MNAQFIKGSLKKSPLHTLHLQYGAKMSPYAGWILPLSYQNMSVLDSVLHTRKSASLFDVSHMLQLNISGNEAKDFLESITPIDMKKLKLLTGKYTLFLNEGGGIIDDLIITKIDDDNLRIVSNASTSERVLGLFDGRGKVSRNVMVALQGPLSGQILKDLKILSESEINTLKFMSCLVRNGMLISRSGYTGEDGFELAYSLADYPEFAQRLISDDRVSLAGLATRDLLRLEAGMCLSGKDFNEAITPVEAGLQWVIDKDRIENIPGHQVIKNQLNNGCTKKRTGLVMKKGPLPREGDIIFDEVEERDIGYITSGNFSPTTNSNIAMAYVKPPINRKLYVNLRGTRYPIEKVKLPFVPNKFYH